MTDLSFPVQEITESGSQVVSNYSDLSMGDKLGVIGILVTLLLAIIGASYKLYKDYQEQKRKLEGLFKITWKKSTSIKKDKILDRETPKEYYYTRNEDNKVQDCLEKGRSILIIGPPLSGKTRIVYEALRKSKKYDVIIPRAKDIEINSFFLPRHLKLWKQKLMFIDDLHNFVENQHFEYLFELCKDKKINLITTCRSGIEYKKTKNRMLEKKLDLENKVFDEIIEIKEISEAEGRRIAKEVGYCWNEIRFNKTVGSVFMPFSEMRKRFTECSSEEKSILRAIKKLYICGVYDESQIFQLNYIQNVSKNEGLNKEKYQWSELITKLCEKEFIKIEDNKIDRVWAEEVYLEDIVALNNSEFSVFEEILFIFADVPEILAKVGCRACDYGNLIKEVGSWREAEEYFKLSLKIDPKDVNALCNYGILLAEIGRKEEAEEKYKLALKFDPNNAATHSNCGNLLTEMGRKEEAEEQYKLALKADPNDASTHYNYGNLLTEMGRREEAEEQYKFAREADPNDADTHSNYGILLSEMGRYEEAEEQYKLALEVDPKHVNTHYNYGNLLTEIGRRDEAEEQFKATIELAPQMPNGHVAYSLLLLSKNLESEAINEMKIASHLFGESGDKVKEHLSFAWLYEELANIYYNLKDYKTSGEYAEISGDEYIEAGIQAGGKFKDTSLTKGYTLKGRAKIRKLDLQPPYNVEMYKKIMDGIDYASKCYTKAAEASPKENQMCDACSISLFCLSEMMDYMLAVIKQQNVPRLEEEIGRWKEQLTVCEQIYGGRPKSETFIQSLYKLMACIENLEKYKRSGMRNEERAFEECFKELGEITRNIEGPLQKIIENSAKQMDLCRLKMIPYAGTKTGYIPKPSKLSQFFKWISDPKRITVGIAGIILTVIVNHYNEYLFSLIKRFVAMLISKI